MSGSLKPLWYSGLISCWAYTRALTGSEYERSKVGCPSWIWNLSSMTFEIVASAGMFVNFHVFAVPVEPLVEALRRTAATPMVIISLSGPAYRKSDSESTRSRDSPCRRGSSPAGGLCSLRGSCAGRRERTGAEERLVAVSADNHSILRAVEHNYTVLIKLLAFRACL